MKLQTNDIETPIGTMRVAARGGSLCAVGFVEHWGRLVTGLQQRFGEIHLEQHPDPAGACSHLAAYFAGDLDALDSLQVDAGGTQFQRQVWAALRTIPVGRTASYSDIARAIAHPAAVRAVGAANGLNPIAVVVPCHRVIRADGSLCGYGGGIERKRWLLEHERAVLLSCRLENSNPRQASKNRHSAITLALPR